jgi:hypothetical protein
LKIFSRPLVVVLLTSASVRTVPANISSLTRLALKLEHPFTDSINAAAPETNGAAMDVPVFVENIETDGR